VSEAIRSMFAGIARRYDVANNAISFGMHRGWKRLLVTDPAILRGAKVLDCACGTGDVAFAALQRVLPNGQVVGVDFTSEMIELATAKIARLSDSWLQVPGETELAAQAVRFEVADVLDLPYPDGSFSAATISFGIRNVDDAVRGIAEMARVVRPGGSVLVLESGIPPNRLWRTLYGLYQSSALWIIGGLLSGNVAAYRYLAGTTRRFPSGQGFVDLMQSAASFREVTATPLLGGVVYIYRGVVA
jgi:demethylmenaquinone methyltransferase / 2-methoxy-6-polyprenyl-1,4-benzoquinol methylase